MAKMQSSTLNHIHNHKQQAFNTRFVLYTTEQRGISVTEPHQFRCSFWSSS